MKTLSNAGKRSRILSSVGTMDKKKRPISVNTLYILINATTTRVHPCAFSTLTIVTLPESENARAKNHAEGFRSSVQRILLTDLSLTVIKKNIQKQTPYGKKYKSECVWLPRQDKTETYRCGQITAGRTESLVHLSLL